MNMNMKIPTSRKLSHDRQSQPQSSLPPSPSISSSSPSSSVTALNFLPDDQRQHVLSYLTCSELLTLTLVSRAVRSIALKSHTLVAFRDEDHTFHPNNRNDCWNTSASNAMTNLTNNPNIMIHTNNHNTSVGSNGSNNESNSNGNPLGDNLDQFPLHISSPSSSSSQSNHNITSTTTSTTSSSSHYHQISFLSSPQQISERNIINLLQRFQQLRTLKLYNLTYVNESIIQIINSCPSAHSIIHLELHNLRLLHNTYSLELDCPVKHRQYLQYVKLSGTIFSSYSKVIRSFCTSPQLHTLILDGCRSLTDDDVYDLSKLLFETNKHPKLRYLSLVRSSKIIHPFIKPDGKNGTSGGSSCMNTDSSSSRSSTLQKLNLSQCQMLSNLSSISCKTLQSIDISNCSLLNDTSIHALFQSCPLLECVNASGCSLLDHLEIRSRYLKCLDMNLCLGLVSLILDCDLLKTLELGFCRKLTKLRLDLPSIPTLDLSLLSIQNLYLQSSQLNDLNLSGCIDLEDTSTFLTCPNLKNLDISGCDHLGDGFEKDCLNNGRKVNVLKGSTDGGMQ